MEKTNNQYSYALTFVSTDSKGLVSEASKVFYENGFNIADSSSTLLHGVFAMIFVVTSPINHSVESIKEMFSNSKIIPHVCKCAEADEDNNDIHYSLSIYGADKSGIVYETTSCLARNNVNIVDLQTRVTGKQSSKVYIMILEVAVPMKSDQEKWQKEITETAQKTGTEINIKKIECYEL